MTYQQIHQMYRDKQSLRKIAKESNLNFRTVKQLLSLSEEEFLASSHKRKGRRKLLGGYEDFVHKRLELYPQTSSAQTHDLWKEAFSDLMVHFCYPLKSSCVIYLELALFNKSFRYSPGLTL